MTWFGWFRRRTLEPAPKPEPRYRYTFTGHDEDLEKCARQRREQAEQIRREARRIETQDDKRATLRRVK